MALINRKEPLVLLIGDLAFLFISLVLSLALRSGSWPTWETISLHLTPFSLLFGAWVVVFYIAGLYDRHTSLLQSTLPNVIGVAQTVNSGLAVVFFYFVPIFGITPKTILFIYLFISSVVILLWRMYGYFTITRRAPLNAVVIGSGNEMKELVNEVNGNPIYGLKFVSSIDLARAEKDGFWNEVVEQVYSENVSLIAIDITHESVEPVLPHLYNLIFSNINFIDMHKIYEDIFYRVPLSLLRYNWFLENISTQPRHAYDVLRRLMDLVVAGSMFLVSLVVYPFVYIAIKLDDGGKIFFTQERVGQGNRVMKIIKFRSMNEAHEVTKVGAFLRKSRIDELPQLLNVLIGDLSLIGPRPEIPTLAKSYHEEIPYYNVRHLIKPGLSGWAQIYGEHGHGKLAVDETRNKLSYDLYYIKNRSFLLDLKIAVRTIKTLVSIAGK